MFQGLRRFIVRKWDDFGGWPAVRNAAGRVINVADDALLAVSESARNAWVSCTLRSPAIMGWLGTAVEKTRGLAKRALYFVRVLGLTIAVVVCLDWGTKIAVNAIIEPVPNSPALVPMDPRDYPRRFYPIIDIDRLAITHLEHAYISADNKWLNSPYASPALDTQTWIFNRIGIEFDLWVVALLILLSGSIAVALLVGMLFRMRLGLIAGLAGAYAGGGIGNSVELGFLNDVTDWIWVASDDMAIVFNLADVAIAGSLLIYVVWPVLMATVLIGRAFVWLFSSPFKGTRNSRKAREDVSAADDAGHQPSCHT